MGHYIATPFLTIYCSVFSIAFARIPATTPLSGVALVTTEPAATPSYSYLSNVQFHVQPGLHILKQTFTFLILN